MDCSDEFLAWAETAPLPVRTVDLSHWFSTRQVVHRREASSKASLTWRYRVLKTALRLRPRRALSSASGQRCHLTRIVEERKRKNGVHPEDPEDRWTED